MAQPLTQLIRGAAYSAAQTARIGWYTAQYVAARHIAGPLIAPGEVPPASSFNRVPERVIREAFLSLVNREARDIAAGVYRLPKDIRTAPNPLLLCRQASRYLEEARRVTRRAYSKGGATEVRDIASEDHLPPYYLQNFHFQTDGWLSDNSADIYDTQVEALFTGVADTMRRRALPCLLKEIDRIRSLERRPVVADIACGTGRLLRDVVDNRPGIDAVGIDLSSAYLKKAAKNVANPRVALVKGQAEHLPFDDDSVDILYSVYLFHELPPKVRIEVAREFGRVLKPGGLYVHIDSVQYGDTPMDIMLENFPRAVHEPYYDSYARQDLNDLFGDSGFVEESSEVGFLTKTNAYRFRTASRR
ncbi:MAG: class I SAM-dependent methyltransferase [Pseudomonadota bacterium]